MALVLLTAALRAPAHAGVNTWTSNGPYGGTIQVLAIDPVTPTTLYAGTFAGLFKTTDAGAHWSRLDITLTNNGEFRTISIDPATPSTLYVSLGSDGLIKSTNGGATWTLLPGITGVSALVIDPASPTTLYAGRGNVYKSTDGGGSWSVSLNLDNLAPAGFIAALAIDPNNPMTVYAARSQIANWRDIRGVFKTTNGGASWTQTDMGYGQLELVTLVVDPSTPTTLYLSTHGLPGPNAGLLKSTDGGTSWSLANAGLKTDHVRALAVDPSNPGVVYGAGNYGVFKTTDGATSWTPAGAARIAHTYVETMVVDPAAPQTLYVGTVNRGVFKTEDGGATEWVQVNTGIAAGPDCQTVVIDAVTPTTMYTATRDGVYKTVDGGLAWSGASAGLPAGALETGVLRLAIDPSNSNTLYATDWTIDSVYVSNPPPHPPEGLYKSTNAGGSWSLSLGNEYFDLAVAPTIPTTVYATGWGLRKSQDGGGTWSPTDFGGLVFWFTVDPNVPTTLYAGNYDGIFRSTDAGTNWLSIAGGPNIGPVVVDSAGNLFYYRSDGLILRSSDAGTTWTAATTVLPSIRSVIADPFSANSLYALTDGGLFRSSDTGASWYLVNSSPLPAEHGGYSGLSHPGPDYGELAHHPTIPTRMYAATARGVFDIDLLCGNGSVDPGEECDDGNFTQGDGCDTNCTHSACGNFILDAGEQCDNGTDNSDTARNACRTDCTFAHCGDGALDNGEECDDGSGSDNDACKNDCTPNICGDGKVFTGVEACDDGNFIDGDGCDHDCSLTGCGNAILTVGEQCDDGNQVSNDACPATCVYSDGDWLIPGNSANPARDRVGCQLEWYVANPTGARGRTGLPTAHQTCQNGDPTCDFRPADSNLCEFQVALCVNTTDLNLPACTTGGITTLRMTTARLLPVLPVALGQGIMDANVAAVQNALQHLLDPQHPERGYNNAVPLTAGQQNFCSAPFPIDIPLASARARTMTIATASTDNHLPFPRKQRARLRLTCKR